MAKIGVMIVHGIGDPKPGAALIELTESMASSQSLVDELTPVVGQRLPQTHQPDPNLFEYFPMYTREGKSKSGDPLVFAEVYWGTATQLKRGWLGVLQGLGRVFFSIMHVVDGALPPELKKKDKSAGGDSTTDQTDEDSASAPEAHLRYYALQIFHVLAQSTSLLMAGPVLALNVLLLLGIPPYLLLQKFVPETEGVIWLMPLFATIVSIVLGRWFINQSAESGDVANRRILPRSWPQFAFGVSLVGIALSWLAFVLITDSPTWFDAALFPANLLRHSFALVLVLSFLLVSQVVIVRLLGSRRRDLTAAALAISLQYFMWVLLVPAFWRFLLFSGEQVDPLSEQVYNSTVFGDGLQWVGAAVLLLILGLATADYVFRAKRMINATRYDPEAQDRLRMVIHPWIKYGLMGMSWFGASALLIAYYQPALSPWIHARVTETIQWLDDAGVTEGGATLIIFVAPLLVAVLRLGLDLANDVMSYIYWNCHAQRRRENRERRNRGFLPSFDAALSRRRPIRSRFYAVANYLLDEENVEQLVVIAHSQGTVIALDELAHSFSRERLADIPVVFVTMGSPITHLYQHYFPAPYPGWQDAQWDELFHRVRRWLNIYRVDDIVGSLIEPPDKHGRTAAKIEQCHIGLGGHLNYWRDARMVERLERFEPFRPIDDQSQHA